MSLVVRAKTNIFLRDNLILGVAETFDEVEKKIISARGARITLVMSNTGQLVMVYLPHVLAIEKVAEDWE